jgi:hypothetical protein
MKISTAILGMTSVLALAGCAMSTPTVETTYGYAVFDIKAGPEIGTARIAEAIKVAVQKNMTRAQITNGIPPSPLPTSAPRFQLVSPFKGSNVGALAAASGQNLQVPMCEGTVLTVNAKDDSMSKYAEGTTFFACMMPYQGGYALDVYTTFRKASGAFNASIMAATLGRTVMGDSSQFIPRTIGQIVDSIKQTGATVTMTEAYP